MKQEPNTSKKSFLSDFIDGLKKLTEPVQRIESAYSDLTVEQTIDMINSLAKVVEANRGWFGNERVAREANEKIRMIMSKTPKP